VIDGHLRMPLFERRNAAYWELAMPAELR